MQAPQPRTFSGTGFFVSSRLLVTNNHVVEGASTIVVQTGGKRVPATIVRTDAVNDLALLKTNVSGKPIPLAASFALRRGSEVAALGYPKPGIQGMKQKATFGWVNATTGSQDDPRYVQTDVPIQGGNSGGPLLSMRGEVVGVITAKLVGADIDNVAYALKVNYLHRLLAQASLSASAPAASGPMSRADIAEKYEASVVLIIASE
jgi:S1-C subfamily serine protease